MTADRCAATNTPKHGRRPSNERAASLRQACEKVVCRPRHGAACRLCQGGQRRLPGHLSRRNAGHRRRVRLRQDDAGPRHDPAERGDGRTDHLQRSGHHPHAGKTASSPAQGHADHLSGPVQQPESAHDRGRHRQRALPLPEAVYPCRAHRARQGAHGALRSGSRLYPPLSARVFRRPAPAHRHRPGARAEPEVHPL